MIEAIKNIGEFAQKKHKNPLEIFLENPNIKGKYKNVLVIIFKQIGDAFKFDKVEFEEFSKEKIKKYLYRKGSSSGTNITPTSKLAESLERTFEKKILQWFKNYKRYNVEIKNKESIKKIGEIIEEKKAEILAQLDNYIKEIQQNAQIPKNEKGILITIGIRKNENLDYIGDIEFFKNILIEESKKHFYYLSSQGVSLAKNHVCFICKENKEEVYGFAIPWAFHTFDKPGFIAGGFDIKQSWKDTPVCFECATKLLSGKKYLEENLDFDFYGFRYFLIPKLVINQEYNEILSILEDFKKKVRLTPEVRKSITSDEKEILELISEESNFFNNNLLFYLPSKGASSAFRILLYIEGILPSRLHKLFEAKNRVDKIFNIFNKLIFEKEQRLQFDFSVLRNFFPRESKKQSYDKTFLEIINQIFIDSYVDYNLILKAIVKQVRRFFINGKPTIFTILNGFLLLYYIKELNLFKNIRKEGNNLMDESKLFGNKNIETLGLEERVELFFNQHGAFFDNAEKKAVFLEGVLTQYLLNIQFDIYKDRKAAPFRTRLHGLKLNRMLVIKLLPEIQNKLEEYGKNYYRTLEGKISQYFVMTEGQWNISDDETSFYFTLGMDLSKLFKLKKETKEQEKLHE